MRDKMNHSTIERSKHMKAISTLALIAAGAVSMRSTSWGASATNDCIEAAFDKAFPYSPQLGYDPIILGEKTSSQASQPAGLQGQDEVGIRLAPPVKPEAAAQPGTLYRPKLELSPLQPNNVVRSERFPHLEYSGISVQALRHNPLQLINPFAPVQYGDGEANTVHNVLTGQPVGLKVLGIHF